MPSPAARRLPLAALRERPGLGPRASLLHSFLLRTPSPSAAVQRVDIEHGSELPGPSAAKARMLLLRRLLLLRNLLRRLRGQLETTKSGIVHAVGLPCRPGISNTAVDLGSDQSESDPSECMYGWQWDSVGSSQPAKNARAGAWASCSAAKVTGARCVRTSTRSRSSHAGWCSDLSSSG